MFAFKKFKVLLDSGNNLLIHIYSTSHSLISFMSDGNLQGSY